MINMFHIVYVCHLSTSEVIFFCVSDNFEMLAVFFFFCFVLFCTFDHFVMFRMFLMHLRMVPVHLVYHI